jgi:hypothetical protein
MKTNYFFLLLNSVIGLLSCSGNKYVISDNDLSGNKVVILGVVEYDYTQLENKNLKGLTIFLESKEKHSDIKLPEIGLQNDRQIKQKFISIVGNYGIYRLSKIQDFSSNESDNLLALMNKDRNPQSSDKRVIQEYSIESGKIINIGKFIVKYQGGQVIDGKINYTYSLHADSNDTLALCVFRETNPSLYKKYSNDVLMFNNEW